MWVWLFDNAEALLALATLVAMLPIGWAARKGWQMLISARARKGEDRAMVERLIQTVEHTATTAAQTSADVAVMRSGMVSLSRRFEAQAARTWELLSATAKDPIFETDAQGGLTRINRGYAELVGRSIDDLRGRGWELTIHPEDLDRVVEEWEAAIAGKRRFESQFRLVGRSGRLIGWVRCAGSPLFCDAGLFTGYFGTYERFDPAQ